MRALILAGGAGTRFWPLSRRATPKQLLDLEGEGSLLRATVDRLAPLVPIESVWVCTTAELAGKVREALPEVDAGRILAEPEGRNTAPAIGWSVQTMAAAAGDGVVAVLPSDHRMADAAAFRRTLEAARGAAEAGDRVIALGVPPTRPETGYGYLELGEALDEASGLRRVARFTEKPHEDDARAFVASGRYLWNAGIFIFRGSTLLAHLARFEPEIGRGLRRIAEDPAALADAYSRLPAISIDYAVMERLEEIAALPLDCGWSDLGSWEALAEVLPADEAGNAARGDTLTLDAAGNLLYADGGTIAALGVRDLVVVRTDRAVLVAPKERSQEVRRIVAELEARRRDDLL